MSQAEEQRCAISPRRDQDFPEWYQQVIKAADLAEHSPVRGCMTIKPWGWAIWEEIRNWLDARIKATGHENAYFPLFVPLSLLEKEADHVEGFAKECAVITHHKLESREGKLVPVGELEETLIVRPTSEALIGEAFSRWIHSWRDLPVKLNQWANVVRWEMRPRLFLRTMEFLWQEGHTAHATEQEAWEESKMMLGEYGKLMKDLLAIPVIAGKKSPGERFPGADETLTLECMTQDRKAIQCCTSHYLGQNFSRAFQVTFNTADGGTEHAYTTSWGVTTRLVGAMTMVHGDDNGLCVPPKVAQYHVVIIPVLTQSEKNEDVLRACRALKEQLEEQLFDGKPVRVYVDDKDMRAGEKGWAWIKKGAPLRVEIGPRDLDSNSCVVAKRDDLSKEKMGVETLVGHVDSLLTSYHDRLFARAKAFLDAHVRTDIATLDEMKAFFTPKNEEKPEIHGGFVRAKWCEDRATEDLLKELKVTIRCLPFEQSGTKGSCIITGRPATCDAIFAKAY